MTTRAWLKIIGGPAKGKVLSLKIGPSVIGAAKSADIVLKDPALSEEHAIVDCAPTGAVILRNRSPNGTRVAGRHINIHELQVGDEIGIGSTIVLLFGRGEVHEPVATSEARPQTGRARRDARSLSKLASPKRVAIALGLVVYLGAMVALFVTLEKGGEADSPEKAAGELASIVQRTRDELRAISVPAEQRALATNAMTSAAHDASALYYQLLVAKSGGQPQQRIDELVEIIILPIQESLREAGILELQGRWREARHHYRMVIDILPDGRLPAVQYSVERLRVIREAMPSER